MTRAGVLVVLALLAACREAPVENAAAPARKADPAKAKVVPLPEAALVGSFTAISNTAAAITGDLDLTADALRFAMDQEYRTGSATRVAAATRFADGPSSWAALLVLPPDTPVEIRPVTGQTIGPKATNGSLCGADTVTFIAYARTDGGGAEDSLKLAAFKGKTAPGPRAAEQDLCGTFLYAPAAAAQE